VTVDGVPSDATSVDDIGDSDDGGDDGSGEGTDDDGGSDSPSSVGPEPSDGGRTVSVNDIDSFDELNPGDIFDRSNPGEESRPVEIISIEENDRGETAAVFTDLETGEDGFTFEDVTLDSGESNELSDSERAIQDAGFNSAYTGNVSSEQAERLAEIVDDVGDERIDEIFGTFGQFTTTDPETTNVNVDDATAAYIPSSKSLYVSEDVAADIDADRDAPPIEDELGGVLLGGSPRRTLQHEFAHAFHDNNRPNDASELRDLTDAEKSRISSEVSSYATYNPKEFVAETYTALANGADLPNDIMELYEELDGPEVRDE
jgi:hypothetical protein